MGQILGKKMINGQINFQSQLKRGLELTWTGHMSTIQLLNRLQRLLCQIFKAALILQNEFAHKPDYWSTPTMEQTIVVIVAALILPNELALINQPTGQHQANGTDYSGYCSRYLGCTDPSNPFNEIGGRVCSDNIHRLRILSHLRKQDRF